MDERPSESKLPRPLPSPGPSRALAPWRRFVLSVAALLAACGGPAEQIQKDLADLRTELAAQRRTEQELRERLDRIDARLRFAETVRAAPVAPKAAPAPAAPRPAAPDDLPTVKLAPAPSATRGAQHAPPLDTRKPILDPSDDDLAAIERVDLEPALDRADEKAEREFAEAVRRYNAGDRLEAGAALAAFARQYPRHGAADNALYLAGMALVAAGRCLDAKASLEEAVQQHPDGDAAAPALLAMARCEDSKGRRERARVLFARILSDYRDTAEASHAEAALADTKGSTAPVAGVP